MPLKSLSEREWDVYGRGKIWWHIGRKKIELPPQKNLVVSDAVDNT